MSTKASLSQASVSIDTSHLKELAAVLRRSQPEVKTAMYKSLRMGGELIRAEAAILAAWSSRIPGSLKVQGSGLHIKVVAQGAIAADAAPLENKGDNGYFRHPVFGNTNVWVDQKAHPFLAPALEARIDQVVELVAEGIDEALVTAGFDD